MTDHPDFSVVVKSRGRPPNPWKWEIYRAGRKSPVKQSEVYFSTVTEAHRAGKKALMVPGVGHFAMQEAPATVTAIGDFLERG